MKNTMELGERLRALRGERSLEETAKNLGISVHSLEDYEASRRVPRDEVKGRMARYYGQSATALFFDGKSTNSAFFDRR